MRRYLATANQTGAASLLTVIFLSLLITVVALSFVRLTVVEQRQSSDDDLTKRAFYAAESGVEDAKRAIAKYQAGTLASLNESVCDPAEGDGELINEPGLESRYTCQLIDLTAPNFQALIPAWQSVQVPLKSSSGFTQVRISWHTEEDGAYSVRSSTLGNWEAVSGWNYPAMPRAFFFWHPNGVFNGAGSLSQSVIFFNPDGGGVSTHNLSDENATSDAQCQSSVPAGGYACSVTVTGFSSANSYFLRLSALYRSAHVQIELLDASGTPVDMQGAQAVVDVTGKAGDAFRRVEARVALSSSDILPDYALQSAENICKRFFIIDDANDPDNPFTSLNPGIDPDTLCQ